MFYSSQVGGGDVGAHVNQELHQLLPDVVRQSPHSILELSAWEKTGRGFTTYQGRKHGGTLGIKDITSLGIHEAVWPLRCAAEQTTIRRRK
jgi:hypothetical protein